MYSSETPVASEIAELAYHHFSHEDALLRKPDGADRYIRGGWEL